MEQKKQYKLIREEQMKEKRLAKAKSHQKAPRFMALKPGQKFNAFPSASDPPKKKLAKSVSLIYFIHFFLNLKFIYSLN